ncbi:MAG: CTP synthase [Alphaproteobacteria bacterium]|nr:MAG: CTP synthase [Alphaproteobacteria bacterium]
MSELKIIFVTGGVMSSLGKGVTASSIASLLQMHGFNVKIRKLEPYLNVDAGTINPEQHGEVFVTDDGIETDMDIGNYERFTEIKCTKNDYITSGQIFSNVIQDERQGKYLGETVQIIPHVTDMIQKKIIEKIPANTDFLICEIGGTVGDIEGMPFLESIKRQANKSHVMYVHIGLMPFLEKSSEFKTKPVQHSISELQKFGIKPNMVLCRSVEDYSDLSWKKKIADFANLPEDMIIPAWNQSSIYNLKYQYNQYNIVEKICSFFKIKSSKIQVLPFNISTKKQINVALITKYQKIQDAYCSIIEAVKHASWANNAEPNITNIDSENINVEDIAQYDAIIVPGGFGHRGIDGKLAALEFARKNDIPCLGICLGMQLMVIECLQNIYKIRTNSSEFEDVSNPAICIINQDEQSKGGTMRLGAYKCHISGKLLDIYSDSCHRIENNIISERHRHRYEVNHFLYKNQLEEVFELSAWSPGQQFLEGFIHKTHPFYLGVQFHPEFQTYINDPHPLFVNLIKAGLNRNNS